MIAEVTQGAKTSGQMLSKLKQSVDCLDGAIGQPSFQESDNGAPMFLNAAGQLAKGFEPTELGALGPAAQSLRPYIYLTDPEKGSGRICEKPYRNSVVCCWLPAFIIRQRNGLPKASN
jgi:hypothetical protein